MLTSSATTPTQCYWDFEDVDASQDIPFGTQPDIYSIDMVLTVVAL